MTLDNSLINDTFMYPYAMEYNAPLAPVYNFNYSCNNNNNNRMVSSLIFIILVKTKLQVKSLKIAVHFFGGDNNKTLEVAGSRLININQ